MHEAIIKLYNALPEATRATVNEAADKIVSAKERGGKVAVVTGSGPNIHEGVTTLIACLMRAGIIDGVTTSSAVVAHEMGGTLDKVKRIDADSLGGRIAPSLRPRGNIFELTLADEEQYLEYEKELKLDRSLIEACRKADGKVIIKAAGNMAYPSGLYNEFIAPRVADAARRLGEPFELAAGLGADPRTMLGAGAELGLPVLVSVPQLIGGGQVGICVGESVSIGERCRRVAQLMGSAEVIIESAVALTQEIHDGPYETYTGHGIWAGWMGEQTYSLKDKTLLRIDLDENLRAAWELDKRGSAVQSAIDNGLPKTKMTKIPFRMEMSAFSRLEHSLPIIGDIGAIWPCITSLVCDKLGVNLPFMSFPQQTDEGKAMREAIVSEVRPFSYERMCAAVNELTGGAK